MLLPFSHCFHLLVGLEICGNTFSKPNKTDKRTLPCRQISPCLGTASRLQLEGLEPKFKHKAPKTVSGLDPKPATRRFSVEVSFAEICSSSSSQELPKEAKQVDVVEILDSDDEAARTWPQSGEGRVHRRTHVRQETRLQSGCAMCACMHACRYEHVTVCA